MSTRSSIVYKSPHTPGGFHLFEDVGEDFSVSGLHLDIRPVSHSSTGQYGDFHMSVDGCGAASISLRLPIEVCEAIADFVVERREWAKKVSENE